MARILVVEDEAHIRELVCLHLKLEGFECLEARDGKAALELAKREPLDLVVLDLMIPGLDGITVCRALRNDAATATLPVLMLTARREESDKVLGLESGADDYLTKPFGVRELVARVRALLRRAQVVPAGAGPGAHLPAAADDPAAGLGKVVRVSGLEIDPARRRVVVDAAPVELTNLEFNLLYLLASHPGIVFSREALLRRLWGADTYVTARSADSLVKRVRQKVESDPASPRFILTVWGAGYKFADV